MNPDEALYGGVGTALEVFVRSIVRDELRRHLGPEGDRLMNIHDAPMSHRKLRQLVASGAIEGFKHGREIFVRASDFRAYIERRPIPPQHVVVPEPAIDEDEERRDELRVVIGLEFTDPQEQRAFELRLAARRAAGGERAASLARAEQRHREHLEKDRVRQERAAKRAAKKAGRKG